MLGLFGCKPLCPSKSSHGVRRNSTGELPAPASRLALRTGAPLPSLQICLSLCAHHQAWSAAPLQLLHSACIASEYELTVSTTVQIHMCKWH